MTRIGLVVFFIWIACLKLSAATVSGTVYADDTKAPIALASVFFSNTSWGGVTAGDGKFVLNNIPGGKYELIVSYVGYETAVQMVETDKLTEPLTILLKPKPKELDNVIIEPYDKDNWDKWGKFFLDNFVGLTALAKDCRIKNTKTISFRNYRKSGRIVAYADEPLIIENKALGYRIKYQLEKFEYNFNTRIFYYQGFPFFEEMDTRPDSKRRRKWEELRAETYRGSLMHFMRSLYRNQLSQNGFQVRYLRKEPNLEKQRIKAIVRTNVRKSPNTVAVLGRNPSIAALLNTDSTAYYDRILSQPDEIDILNPTVLPGDSVAFAIDSVTAGMFFPNYLHVTFTGKKEPIEYAQSQGRSKLYDRLVSLIDLPPRRVIAIASNGSFYNPADVLLSGYWGFWEKMATMLPVDYEPAKKTTP